MRVRKELAHCREQKTNQTQSKFMYNVNMYKKTINNFAVSGNKPISLYIEFKWRYC